MGKFPGKKKVVQSKETPANLQSVQPVSPTYEAQVSNPSDEFWQDPKHEQALNMAFAGVPKTQIARTLVVHRHTITSWFSHPTFVAELTQRMREHMSSTRVNRLQGTNALTQRLQKITLALGADVERQLRLDSEGVPLIEDKDRPKLEKTLRLFREMGYEFREFREQERKDYGDDVKKVSINQQTTITGDVTVQHSGVNDVPFADYIKNAIDTKAIDVDVIEAGEDKGSGQLLLKAAEHLLVDSDLLDRINEEDKAHEEAEKASQ